MTFRAFADATRPGLALPGPGVDSRWRSDARTIESKYGQGILATKSILNTDHPTWAIPAPVLALLLQ